MNLGALAYNAAPLSGVKPLLRERKSLRPVVELNLNKSFPRWKPPRSKRSKHLVGNSSAPLAKSSTNAELLV
jgi:hypothetical protein